MGFVSDLLVLCYFSAMIDGVGYDGILRFGSGNLIRPVTFLLCLSFFM